MFSKVLITGWSAILYSVLNGSGVSGNSVPRPKRTFGGLESTGGSRLESRCESNEDQRIKPSQTENQPLKIVDEHACKKLLCTFQRSRSK